MAKRVVNYLIDDLDGTEPAKTVSFGYKGSEYEIDLAEHNADRFDEDMKRYVDVARKVAGRGRVKRSASRHQKLQAARAWLRENGHPDLGDRGRIPAELMAKFEAAAPTLSTESGAAH